MAFETVFDEIRAVARKHWDPKHNATPYTQIRERALIASTQEGGQAQRGLRMHHKRNSARAAPTSM